MTQILLDSNQQSRNSDLQFQDKVIGYIGAAAVFIVVLALVRRLLFGKSKPRLDPKVDIGVKECPCGYYLVESDKVCPKCHAEITPPSSPV